MRNTPWLAAVLVLTVTTVAAAQGLADVARAEQERRKVAAKATKVYTNDSLKVEPPPSQPVVPASTASTPPQAVGAATPQATTPAAEATAATAVAVSDSKSALPVGEVAWRARASELRGAVVRQQILADALQSRINALRTDFVNRDDPAQRAVIETDRGKALTELERVRKDLKAAEQSVKDLDEQARKQGVPAGWLR